MSTHTNILPFFPAPQAQHRILIVDDHPVNLFFARTMLHKLGFKAVDTAKDGFAALEMIELRSYDIIIVDCQMPGMDGFEVSRMIRKSEAGTPRHVPIIAMTANAVEGNRQKCLDAGIDDYVSKSIGGGHMLDTMMKWLKNDLEFETNATPNPAQVPNADSSAPPVNMAFLEEFVGDDEEAKNMAIALFIDGANECMDTLAAARDSGNNEAWKQAAHKLKGAAANFGAAQLQQYCHMAEQIYQSTGRDKTEAYRMIEDAYHAVQDYMNKQQA